MNDGVKYFWVDIKKLSIIIKICYLKKNDV